MPPLIRGEETRKRYKKALERIRAGEIPEGVKREGLFACLSWFETVASLALHPVSRQTIGAAIEIEGEDK